VYISHIPWEQELTEDEKENGIIVMPSTLDGILPRIIAYQAAEKATGKTTVVLIGGDNRAPCSSVLRAIDCAKRAQVDYIVFETRASGPSHMAFKTEAGGCELKYFEFPSGFKPTHELAKNIVTVTISENGAIQWGNTPVTREDFVNELLNLMKKGGRDKALFVVRVDANAPFPVLSYVLNEAMRIGLSKVMITQR
jgi:biopolymer transport protein ExbD